MGTDTETKAYTNINNNDKARNRARVFTKRKFLESLPIISLALLLGQDELLERLMMWENYNQLTSFKVPNANSSNRDVKELLNIVRKHLNLGGGDDSSK